MGVVQPLIHTILLTMVKSLLEILWLTVPFHGYWSTTCGLLELCMPQV